MRPSLKQEAPYGDVRPLASAMGRMSKKRHMINQSKDLKCNLRRITLLNNGGLKEMRQSV